MRKSKFLICMLLVLALVIAIPAAILANDSASSTGNVPEYGGNIYNAGTVNISGGTVYGGVARYGGNLFNAASGNLTVSGGAKILDGVAYVLGGNVYATNGSVFNKGGQIANSGTNYDGIYAPVHSSCICGSNTAIHATGCDGDKMAIEWKEWTSATTLPRESGYYYLTGNVTVTETTSVLLGADVSVDVVLDLNGKTIYRSGSGRIWNMNQGTGNKLTVLDSVGSGRIELGAAVDTGSLVNIDGSNVFTMYGGTVNGANVRYTNEKVPGAVIRVGAVNAKGTVNIYGGKIIGGTAVNHGGGVVGMSGGTLNMTAGEITGGTAKLGGNIYMVAGSNVNLSGEAMVTDGVATKDGFADSGSIYVEDGASLNISEDAVVSGGISYGYPENNTVLCVGYGKAKITPTSGTVITGGNGGSVGADKWDDIYAIAVYMKDNANHEYLHVVLDVSWAGLRDNTNNPKGLGDEVRDIAESLGIDPAVVTVGGTHAHASVAYANGYDREGADEGTKAWRYGPFVEGVKAAINAAKSTCAPATMSTARTETDGLTFVRRYTTNDPNYNGYFDGFNAISTDIPSDLKHETEADEEIQLIKFEFENGDSPILMINWQSHATLTDNYAVISPDFAGALRDTVDAAGYRSVFYQGAAGNLAPTSKIESENKYTSKGTAAAKEVGEMVAAYVLSDNVKFTAQKTGGIQLERQTLSATNSKYDSTHTPELVAAAKDVLAKAAEYQEQYGNNWKYHANKYAVQKGLQSYYHADSIIEHEGFTSNVKRYEINAISVGDVAFVTLPMEFSDVLGVQLKTQSNFKMVMLLGYSCGTGEYLMHDAAYVNGGYETYETYFIRGTGEKVVGEYLDMLGALYTTRY